MILVDTSIWVDHLRTGDALLAELLSGGFVLGHSWVIGELALGTLGHRPDVLALLDGLPQAEVATVEEVATMIEVGGLSGRGIGYVDAQLLAATRLTPDALLWTRDKRLATLAVEQHVHFEPTTSRSNEG